MSARVLLVALGSLLVACGSLAASGGTGDLRGRTFLSTAVTENGQAKQLVVGTRIRLNFADDGARVGANAGCNHMGGEARLENGRLIVGDLAMTAMGCDGGRSEQDEWLAKFLAGRPSLRLSGAELVLASGTTDIRLLDREVADPDRPLVATRWIVESIIDRNTASSIPRGASAHALLTADGGLTGTTGCNQMGGSVLTTSTTIRFSEVVTTKMACEPDRMRLERAVLDVLRDEVKYEIEADLLRLRHPSGNGLDLRAER
ncbi:MAG: META domain-containing protein [Candidatus Limnocylindria bacterium]